MHRRIPFSHSFLVRVEIPAAAKWLRSGWVAEEPKVWALESAFARTVGALHAVATSSGAAALHLAPLAGDTGAGDEVLCPSLGSVATANAIVHARAKPVFADVDLATPSLNPEDAALFAVLRREARG